MLVFIDRNHNIENTTREIIECRVETSVLVQRVVRREMESQSIGVVP